MPAVRGCQAEHIASTGVKAQEKHCADVPAKMRSSSGCRQTTAQGNSLRLGTSAVQDCLVRISCCRPDSLGPHRSGCQQRRSRSWARQDVIGRLTAVFSRQHGSARGAAGPVHRGRSSQGFKGVGRWQQTLVAGGGGRGRQRGLLAGALGGAPAAAAAWPQGAPVLRSAALAGGCGAGGCKSPQAVTRDVAEGGPQRHSRPQVALGGRGTDAARRDQRQAALAAQSVL